MAIGARVTVSMLAETIGRFERQSARQPAREVDRRRIAADHHAALRGEDEVVERAAADLREHGGAGLGGNGGKGSGIA